MASFNSDRSSRKTGRELAVRAMKRLKLISRFVMERARVLSQNGSCKFATRVLDAQSRLPLGGSEIITSAPSNAVPILALVGLFNAQLLDRRMSLVEDTTPKLSEQCDRACAHLDDDIASGYMRVLRELVAASWTDARKWPRSSAPAFMDGCGHISRLARKADAVGKESVRSLRRLGPLTPRDFWSAENSSADPGDEGSPLSSCARRIEHLIRIAGAH